MLSKSALESKWRILVPIWSPRFLQRLAAVQNKLRNGEMLHAANRLGPM